jgi:hypothetical protein
MALHGAGAGIVHPLPAGSLKQGTWTYAETQEEAILGGRTYVNIHSDINPGGEIRGQVVDIVAPIDGVQAGATTNGHGSGFFAIDRGTDQLSYAIRFADLNSTETVAHIHGFALPGMPAGVQHALPLGSPKIGTWAYPAGDEQRIRDGLTYVNIHSLTSPGGEIRGQIIFPEPGCAADVVCDNEVNVLDLLEVLSNWGPYSPCPPFLAADVNEDCTVDVLDLLEVLSSWGPC